MKPASTARRINVVGTSGSGKTTVGRQIAARLALPCHEMDACFWGPDWTASEDEVFLRRIEAVCSGESWVLDGNYQVSQDVKWQRCELVVWLDRPFFLTLVQVLKRAVSRSISGEEIWAGTGNRETIRRSFFARDSVVWWSIKTWRRNRRRYLGAMSDPRLSYIRFVRLQTDADIEEFLSSLGA